MVMFYYLYTEFQKITPKILKYISDADVGFTLEGLGRYTSLMDAAKEIEAIDPAAANLTKL